MKSLSLKKRLFLLAFLSLFPLIVLVTKTVYNTTLEVRNINKELHSLKNAETLLQLLNLLQKHRGLSFIYLNSSNPDVALRKRIEKIENEIELLLLHLKENFLREKVEKRFTVLKIKSKVSSPLYSFQMHTQLIKELLDDLKQEAKDSGLLFDKRYKVRALSDFAFLRLPQIAEATGELRGLGSGILARGEMTEKEREKISSMYQAILGFKSVIDWSLENFNFDAKVKSYLKNSSELLERVAFLIKNSLLKEELSKTEPVKFFDSITLLVDRIYQVNFGIISSLEEDLENRLSLLHKELIFETTFGLVFFSFVFFWVSATYKQTVNSLNLILAYIEKISKGHLNVSINLDTKDEISVIAKALNQAVARLRDTLSLLSDYKKAVDEGSTLFKVSPEGMITYANKKFEVLSGYLSSEVIGKHISFLYKDFTPKEVLDDMLTAIKQRKMWKGRLVGKGKNDKKCIVDTVVVPVFEKEDKIVEFVVLCHDVTELEEKREKLKYLLYNDSLTGLPNRRKLIEDIKTIEHPALCVLDINNFSALNELYGEKCGDYVLKRIGERLKSGISACGLSLYRLDSDEFALLCDLSKHTLEDFSSYCLYLMSLVEKRPFVCEYGGIEIFATLFGGIAEVPKGKDNILFFANRALKEAKQKKEKLVVLQWDELKGKRENYKKVIHIVKLLKESLAKDRVVPYYQPIVNNLTKEVKKFEALVRILRSDGGVVSPGEFLPVAFKTGLYREISRELIKKVLKDFETIPFQVSLNLSYQDIAVDERAREILSMVRDFPEPERITFEILETEEIENFKFIFRFIEKIKELGCKFAIDDFGSGYSNFEHLAKMEVDFLKIDGSIIKRLKEDKKSRVLVEGIVSFSRELDIQTVAEFVSDRELYEIVRSLGVNYSQGYYFGKPEPLEVIKAKYISSP